jgi:protein involved in polysaccharide export with SLBB domain
MNARLLVSLALACAASTGCGAARYFLTPDKLQEFMLAGPVTPELDRDAMMRAIPPPGPYRLAAGDVVEIRGPHALFARATEQATAAQTDVHLARVDAKGEIQVPLAGTVPAHGRTLLEIEAAVAEAVHPKFLVTRPSIVVRILEYHRVPVTVLGAVETPGIHELRTDQLTLFGALGAAGGILRATNLVVGARMIRVRRNGGEEERDVALPVKGLNVPFADVKLRGGETIEVERYEPDTFTVVGLVTKPGAYEYPPEVTYNLMQALAVAGGVDRVADPPYATVFRKDASGRIVPGTFEIYGDGLVESSVLPIKPGDVIVVEHTPVTWTRSLLAQILTIQFNLFYDPLN